MLTRVCHVICMTDRYSKKIFCPMFRRVKGCGKVRGSPCARTSVSLLMSWSSCCFAAFESGNYGAHSEDFPCYVPLVASSRKVSSWPLYCTVLYFCSFWWIPLSLNQTIPVLSTLGMFTDGDSASLLICGVLSISWVYISRTSCTSEQLYCRRVRHSVCESIYSSQAGVYKVRNSQTA